MKKINIYKDTPEEFHVRLCDTLEQLEEKRSVRFSVKKIVVVCAAAVLALSAITVGAAELFQWYEAARESLGTQQELENKLTYQGVAVPAEDTAIQGDIEITALQAVKKDKDFYLLAAMKVPEDLEWNGDILFGESHVDSDQEFKGCTANFEGEPDENGIVYVEILLLCEPDIAYSGEVTIVLTNLIQTAKSAYADTLAEAEWRLDFMLPTDGGTRSFLQAQALSVNGHEIVWNRVEITPFAVRLYTEEEQGRHASYYSNMELAAVQYQDGSRVEEFGAFLKRSAGTDEEENFYFNLSLENAIDIDKVSALVFQENGEEITVALGENGYAQAAEENVSGDKPGEVTLSALTSEIHVDNFHILYVRWGYVTLTDNKNIYLWDSRCGSAEVIFRLADYGFDADKGGEIAMMPGGVMLAVHPGADADKVYLLDMDTFAVSETSAEGMWPVPRYEDYQSSFFQVTEQVSETEHLPEGFYAPEGFETQEGAYVLYSADGSVENMELLNL